MITKISIEDAIREIKKAYGSEMKDGQNDLFARTSLDKHAGEVILKVVNTAASARQVGNNLVEAGKVNQTGKAFVLASTDLKAENSLNESAKVAPVERRLAVPSGHIAFLECLPKNPSGKMLRRLLEEQLQSALWVCR